MERGLVFVGVVAAVGWALMCGRAAAAEQRGGLRLPEDVLPVIAAWFWQEPEFEPGGYEPYLDLMAGHSAADVLATSLRVWKKEVTDGDVHDQIKRAAAYARTRGMRIAMDLDVRLARAAFRTEYPDELQEMLRLREIALSSSGDLELAISSDDLGDHYTFRTTHYIPLTGRLVRVYSYVRGRGGIDPATVQDMTAACAVRTANEKEVRVAVPCDGDTEGRTACVMASFTHLTPAVFAPHVMPFQRQIIEGYAGADLAGVCKDEWGFPPCFDGCPDKNDYWFSTYRAEAYAERTGGRDLIRDCLLMTYGEQGRGRERQAAINHFLDMSTLRNAAIETDFYRVTKKVFGPSAIVATHPTWYPYPGTREFKKNGLDWWMVPRDLAQTDEVTPYCVRTALAKKCGSAVWYNMFYSSDPDAYRVELWAHALGGGRIDYHPVYPQKGEHPYYHRYELLLRGGLMRGDCRVRLLNFIAKTPLDCPVAVVFGHACAMNWAGPAYDDVGIGLTDALWQAGYPADLIPTSEIREGTFRVAEDGALGYGCQRYRAVVLYHPEFEPPETAAVFRNAAAGATLLYRVGDWTRDFDGRDLDGVAALPDQMNALADPAELVRRLEGLGVVKQSPATRTMTAFGRTSSAPATRGTCRLVDGTVIVLSGADDVAGDPIQTTFDVNGRSVAVDALGVVGVRLLDDGRLDALAAGGLKRFEAGDLVIDLPNGVDLALWRDTGGNLHGVLQDWTGPVPDPLLDLTQDWRRLDVPAPFK